MSTGLIITKRVATHALHDSTEIAVEHDCFMVDADGSFEGKFKRDSTADTIPVLTGVIYPAELLLAQATGAVGVTEVYLYKTEPRGA